MTIFLSNKTEIKKFNYDQIKSDLNLQLAHKEFLQTKKIEQNSVRCLYVGQREIGTVSSDDPYLDIIGSDDSTTCHILLLVDESNFNCSLCHFDGSETQIGLNSMIESLKSLRSKNEQAQFSVYSVGGFDDPKKSSIELTHEIFDSMINSTEIFNIRLCINTELNTIERGSIKYPIIYGMGYEIKTKRVFMCDKFLDKGPDMQARNARHFSNGGNIEIYDPVNHRLVIGPFDYKVYDYMSECLNLPIKLLLKYFSTSPEQEPEHFADNLRQTFTFMCQHPKPLKTYFKNDQPFMYIKQDDGSWMKLV